ncbi:MAG: hypothetical protein M1504_01615, partial [Candidatus Marsarchaeota archaeon]|nr:hypothetical protein [Candidatus Marsarchaeota archaeon]
LAHGFTGVKPIQPMSAFTIRKVPESGISDQIKFLRSDDEIGLEELEYRMVTSSYKFARASLSTNSRGVAPLLAMKGIDLAGEIALSQVKGLSKDYVGNVNQIEYEKLEKLRKMLVKINKDLRKDILRLTKKLQKNNPAKLPKRVALTDLELKMQNTETAINYVKASIDAKSITDQVAIAEERIKQIRDLIEECKQKSMPFRHQLPALAPQIDFRWMIA